MTVLDDAHSLADRGWHVFPIKANEKMPAIPKSVGGNGVLDATIDHDIIQGWFHKNLTWNLAVATGAASDLSVIDIDGPFGLETINRFHKATGFFNNLQTYVVSTPNGIHAYYKFNPGVPNSVNLLKPFRKPHAHDATQPMDLCERTHVDARSVGGYVVSPPSKIFDKFYEVKYDRNVLALPYIHDAFNEQPANGVYRPHTANVDMQQEHWVTEGMRGVGAGLRNDMAARLVGHYHGRVKLPEEEIRELMYGYASRCTPPLALWEIDNTIKSIMRKPIQDTASSPDPDRLSELPSIIEGYVKKSNSYFTIEEIDREFHITTGPEKAVRRETLENLHASNIIQPHVSSNNRYRKVDDTMEVFDLTNIIEPDPLPIEFPLGLHNQVDMYEGSLFVLAGSPNAGKSAFLLNTALLNRDRFNVRYVNSEMGPQELMKRLALFRDVPLVEWQKIVFAQKQSNMVDAVQYKDLTAPTLVIVDFLSIQGEEFFRIGASLEHMVNAIGNKGVLIVAIQKKHGEANIYGRGAEFSAERARLYCSLDRLPESGNNVIQIVKGKNWHGDLDPTGQRKEFKILRGATLEDITEWHFPSK